MAEKKKLSGGHIRHLGYTIPGAAEELEVPEGVIRRAVKNGDIEAVPFAGLPRIPPREIERVRNLFKAAEPA